MQLVTPQVRRALNIVATVVAVALVYALAVGMRWHICSIIETANRPAGVSELPYMLESALLFHYAEQYQQTGVIPRVDQRAQVPEGLDVARELSLGKGLVAAWLYNGLGIDAMSFQRFVRRFDAAWYALAVVPLFFFVRGRTRSLLAASLAALLVAGAYTAVVRSTGLEFSRENFALPLIFAHFWLLDLGRRKRQLTVSVIAGVVLAVGLATWDLAQLYLLLAVGYWAVRCLIRRAAAVELMHLAPTLAAGFVAGLIVPYLWAHRFVVSYAMLAGYGLLAWWAIEKYIKRPRLSALASKGVLVVLVAGMLFAAALLPAGKTYGHFRDLFFAKVRHLNVKPEDPERLSYDARILWVPALHSATGKFMGRRPISDFTAMFILGLLAAGFVIAAKSARRDIGEISFVAGMMAVWLVLYVLFVRMHVFLIFFLAAFIGLGIGAIPALAKRRWVVVFAAPVVVLFLIADMGRGVLFAKVSEDYKQYVPQSQYVLYESADLIKLHTAYGLRSRYGGTAKLVEWLRANTPEDAVVLSSFTLQPTIYEYANRAIVLHPKFESMAMRDKVRDFLETFFGRSERKLHEFCLKNDVDYFVLDLGMFGGPDSKWWIYSPRYAVASTAKQINAIGTRWMYEDPDKCGYFRFQTEIGAKGERLALYRVFKVVSEADMKEADAFTQVGVKFMEYYLASNEAEHLSLAAEALEEAVKLWPGCRDAYREMMKVYALLGNTTRAVEAKTRWEQLEQQEQ